MFRIFIICFYFYISLQIGTVRTRLPSDVARKVVWAPAFARPRNEEPVVVQTHLEASDLVVAITMRLFTAGRSRAVQIHQLGTVRCRRDSSSPLQILLVRLEILDGWRRSGRGRCGVVVGVRIEYLSDQHADPAGRREATAVQVVTASLQAAGDFDRLGEVTFVGNLDDIAPGTLIVLGEHGSGVFHLGRAGSWWSVVSRAGSGSDFFASFGNDRMGNRHWGSSTVRGFTLNSSVYGAKPNNATE